MASFGRKGLVRDSVPASRPSVQMDGSRGPVRFDVTPRPGVMILGIALGGTGVLLFLAKLLDPRGVLINGIISLGPRGADLLFAGLLLASLVMMAVAARGLAVSLGETVWLTLEPRAICGPSTPSSGRTVRIPYEAVKKLRVQQHNGNQYLTIVGSDGQKIAVGSTTLRNPADWPELLRQLDERLR
jgi:hypothetical protein